LGVTNAPPAAAVVWEKLYPDVELPRKATAHSAGRDLRAYLLGAPCRIRTASGIVEQLPSGDDDATPFVELPPGATAIVPLGFRTSIPAGYEIQIRPRSGTSFTTDLMIANAPGTIDADYRGEWGVVVRNVGASPLRIEHGQRIAQAVLALLADIPDVDGAVDETVRGKGGFGSTGAS
jgi:dUTP pyrophosphatase